MSAKTLGAVAAATLALSLAGAARAAVIFDTGPTIGGGLEATEARVADDFKFAADTTVDGAGVIMNGHIENWTGGFQYQIYSDVADQPGAVLTEGDVTTHPVDTGEFIGSEEQFLFQFDFLAPFHALAGQTYFLAVHARSDFRDNDGIFWAFGTPDGSLGSQFQQNGQGDFIPIGGNMSFFLTGAGAPEPATWALMLGGFGLAGAGLRVRRRLVTQPS
jgi:PEP-CTERM motif